MEVDDNAGVVRYHMGRLNQCVIKRATIVRACISGTNDGRANQVIHGRKSTHDGDAGYDKHSEVSISVGGEDDKWSGGGLALSLLHRG